jgi:hypothetical protein
MSAHWYELVDRLDLARHVIHQQILAEGVRGGEVGFAAAHLRDFLHELNQTVVGGKHEGIDHDSGALALGNFLQGFADDKWVEAEGIFVDASVFEGEGGWFAVGDHDDLLHVFSLTLQHALGEAQAFAGVGVVGADFHASELGEWNFFRGIVEENERKRVAGVLRANQLRERHGDFLCRGEAIFAVENHRVRTVEHERQWRRMIDIRIDGPANPNIRC